ncbi:MAG: DUF29 domain-containing protein [Cyanobacteriota bacterium]|nr:DUF29 domain-containing protein [Cyanobacteriota bacterium]
MMDWQKVSLVSHYQTAIAIQNEMLSGNLEEAEIGLEELIEALSRSDKRALKSQLVRLMMHIIKWKTQPQKRSFSWVASINNAREEILEIQEETPSLNDNVIQQMWDKCFKIAQRQARAEMNQKTELEALSWSEVFEDEYEIEAF